MKLPDSSISPTAALEEFDIWITPALGEIRDTARYKQEMDRVVDILDALSEATFEFASIDVCRPAEIANMAIKKIASKTPEAAAGWLRNLASVLFLVTGKSDNNAKCQLPLFLRDQARWTSVPTLNRARTGVSQAKIPRALKAESFMNTVAQLHVNPVIQLATLKTFVNFVLNDAPCVAQLWAIGRSYSKLKEIGRERDLLAPLVIFQVRGSVAASGGHEPEAVLRQILRDWGLRDEVDFNLTDAVVASSLEGGIFPAEGEAVATIPRQKTRAYDFILPFRTPTWTPRIFIQCQFYAGDSGSVSHKNIDQTKASRTSVLALVSKPRFVEFVDGAGYFSSLNGDLKSLLSMREPVPTSSFFQVRSAAVRLRRELQAIGFLTPIDLEHAILRTKGDLSAVKRLLSVEGYADLEIQRTIIDCKDRRAMSESGRRLVIQEGRRDTARRYLLLDVIVCRGQALDSQKERLSACLLVPGYGPFWGMKMDEAISATLEMAPEIATDWQRPESALSDIRWLVEKGYVISS